MTKFSANLGLLWTELSLLDAIRAAGRSGFDAVECHWPYDTPVPEVRKALLETGLPMLSLNTVRGGEGAFGLSALPGRKDEARAAIRQAIGYGAQIGVRNVHVMAGFAEGEDARATFIANLRYACDAGYTLVGSVTTTCLSDQTWSSLAPSCAPSSWTVSPRWPTACAAAS